LVPAILGCALHGVIRKVPVQHRKTGKVALQSVSGSQTNRCRPPPRPRSQRCVDMSGSARSPWGLPGMRFLCRSPISLVGRRRWIGTKAGPSFTPATKTCRRGPRSSMVSRARCTSSACARWPAVLPFTGPTRTPPSRHFYHPSKQRPLAGDPGGSARAGLRLVWRGLPRPALRQPEERGEEDTAWHQREETSRFIGLALADAHLAKLRDRRMVGLCFLCLVVLVPDVLNIDRRLGVFNV
jgi:hypothetical protein